jgi:hypothetical protein
MTRVEADRQFDDALAEHSREVRHVFKTQSEIERVLRMQNDPTADESALFASVVNNEVEYDQESKRGVFRGFWRQLKAKLVGV